MSGPPRSQGSLLSLFVLIVIVVGLLVVFTTVLKNPNTSANAGSASTRTVTVSATASRELPRNGVCRDAGGEIEVFGGRLSCALARQVREAYESDPGQDLLQVTLSGRPLTLSCSRGDKRAECGGGTLQVSWATA